MKRRKAALLGLCAALTLGMGLSVYAQEDTEEAAETVEPAADDMELNAPTDFTYDPNTGEYSFTAVDDRAAYYFVRIYKTEGDREVGEYVASSKRINGKKIGEVSGTVDLSEISWGSYHVNLTTFVPAGTDYIKPDPQTISVQYGVGEILERPELMVMTSGSQAELIVDWYTLSDYAIYEYMPYMQFTFYADADCTEEVLSDKVDLSVLPSLAEYLPPANAYAWGADRSGNGQHIYTMHVEESMFSQEMDIEFSFKNDVFTYQLDPGTYYVTCQALARDEFVNDSQVSVPVEITLTEGESTADYETVKSELWKDPVFGMDRVYASAGQQPDRVDAAERSVSGQLLDHE